MQPLWVVVFRFGRCPLSYNDGRVRQGRPVGWVDGGVDGFGEGRGGGCSFAGCHLTHGVVGKERADEVAGKVHVVWGCVGVFGLEVLGVAMQIHDLDRERSVERISKARQGWTVIRHI